jgi:hypothetical protein
VAVLTLILAMSKAEGVYMSVDYRVTNMRTGQLLDDASVKFLSLPAGQGRATGR